MTGAGPGVGGLVPAARTLPRPDTSHVVDLAHGNNMGTAGEEPNGTRENRPAPTPPGCCGNGTSRDGYGNELKLRGTAANRLENC